LRQQQYKQCNSDKQLNNCEKIMPVFGQGRIKKKAVVAGNLYILKNSLDMSPKQTIFSRIKIGEAFSRSYPALPYMPAWHTAVCQKFTSSTFMSGIWNKKLQDAYWLNAKNKC